MHEDTKLKRWIQFGPGEFGTADWATWEDRANTDPERWVKEHVLWRFENVTEAEATEPGFFDRRFSLQSIQLKTGYPNPKVPGAVVYLSPSEELECWQAEESWVTVLLRNMGTPSGPSGANFDDAYRHREQVVARIGELIREIQTATDRRSRQLPQDLVDLLQRLRDAKAAVLETLKDNGDFGRVQSEIMAYFADRLETARNSATLEGEFQLLVDIREDTEAAYVRVCEFFELEFAARLILPFRAMARDAIQSNQERRTVREDEQLVRDWRDVTHSPDGRTVWTGKAMDLARKEYPAYHDTGKTDSYIADDIATRYTFNFSVDTLRRSIGTVRANT